MGLNRIVGGRIFLLAAFVLLAIGYNEYLKVKNNEDRVRKLQNQERYWDDSGINELHLLQFLNDKRCQSSSQRFFACANILGNMAYQIGYRFFPDKGFRKMGRGTEGLSEKKMLEPWLRYLEDENGRKQRMANFSFERYWRILRTQIPSRKRSMALGIGINSYFSIMNDPHTYIIPAKYYEEVIAQVEGPSLQTGIWLGKLGKAVFVKKVAEDSPVAEANIFRGDRLVKIDGKILDKMALPQIYDFFKGPVGSTIHVEYIRNNESTIRKATVLRKDYIFPSVKVRYIDGHRPFGYLAVNKFAIGVCDRTRTELQVLLKRKISGLILDLRDNPGGQIEEASCIASLFLGPKKIFELQYLERSGPPEEFFGKSETVYSGPLAVLVNAGTASASEILAGAIQDYNRGLLVGGRTFGKGSFQEGDYWTGNGKLLLFETKGLFLLPSGHSPQAQGLEPDIKMPQDFSDEVESNLYLNPLKAQATTNLSSVTLDAVEQSCKESGDDESKLILSKLRDREIQIARRILMCNQLQIGGRVWL